MTETQIQHLIQRIDKFEQLLVADRDHPKEETFSRKMYDLEQKVVHIHDIFELKLDAILEQTTKTNGRVTSLEQNLNEVKIEHITDSASLRGKTSVIVAVVGFVASILGAIITFVVTSFIGKNI